MKKAMFVLLCLCLIFQTACAINNGTNSSSQNNHHNGTDEDNITYKEESEESDKGDTTFQDIANDDKYNQNDKSDEKLIDFLSHETWYCYFMDEDETKLYTMRFYPSSNKMEWKTGYYEGEWENTFVGTYSIGKEGVFLADLYDELRDAEMQISFTVDIVNSDIGEEEISLNITNSSLDNYKGLVDDPIRFALNLKADYPLKLSDFTIEQQQSSEIINIHIVADRQLTLKDNALYDGSDEEYFRFSILKNMTEDDYFNSISDKNVQYNENEALNSTTTSGYSYRIYYNDLEIRKGQVARCYKIFIAVPETDMILIDAYHYTFKEPMSKDDYLNEYILPVVQSIDIEYS